MNDNNIIFDIKSDITFKNIFFKKCGINYMKQILENLFDINKELIINNNEITTNKNNKYKPWMLKKNIIIKTN